MAAPGGGGARPWQFVVLPYVRSHGTLTGPTTALDNSGAACAHLVCEVIKRKSTPDKHTMLPVLRKHLHKARIAHMRQSGTPLHASRGGICCNSCTKPYACTAGCILHIPAELYAAARGPHHVPWIQSSSTAQYSCFFTCSRHCNMTSTGATCSALARALLKHCACCRLQVTKRKLYLQ